MRRRDGGRARARPPSRPLRQTALAQAATDATLISRDDSHSLAGTTVAREPVAPRPAGIVVTRQDQATGHQPRRLRPRGKNGKARCSFAFAWRSVAEGFLSTMLPERTRAHRRERLLRLDKLGVTGSSPVCASNRGRTLQRRTPFYGVAVADGSSLPRDRHGSGRVHEGRGRHSLHSLSLAHWRVELMVRRRHCRDHSRSDIRATSLGTRPPC
jgi:hypothetical protein